MASATTAPLTKDNNMLKFYQLELHCGTPSMAPPSVANFGV